MRSILILVLVAWLFGCEQPKQPDESVDPLAAALENGSDEEVQAIFNAGRDVNQRVRSPHFPEIDGLSPIMAACLLRRCSTVLALINANADIAVHDADRTSLLHYAARLCSKEVIDTLIMRGVDVNATNIRGETPLKWALSNQFSKGATQNAEAMITAGADPHLRDHVGVTHLIVAVENGLSEIVDLLIEAGVDIHARSQTGFSALDAAAYSGNTYLVTALLDAGANADARDHEGGTALMWAASGGNAETVRLLLEAGADPNATLLTVGSTALHNAAGRSSSAEDVVLTVELLINAGAAVDPRDSQGRTPLMLAVLHGVVEVAETLVRAGADIRAIDANRRDIWTLVTIRFSGDGPSGRLGREMKAFVESLRE